MDEMSQTCFSHFWQSAESSSWIATSRQSWRPCNRTERRVLVRSLLQQVSFACQSQPIQDWGSCSQQLYPECHEYNAVTNRYLTKLFFLTGGWVGTAWSRAYILQKGNIYSSSRNGTSFLARTNTFNVLAVFVFGSCKSRTPIAVPSGHRKHWKVGHANWHFEIRLTDECVQVFLLGVRQHIDERQFHRWRRFRRQNHSARTTLAKNHFIA